MGSARRFLHREAASTQPEQPEQQPSGGHDTLQNGRLRLGARLYKDIINHLTDVLPQEGCGLVAFYGPDPVKVYPGTNVLQSTTRYRMSDHEVLKAVEDMDRQGYWLGAIYHSHPNSAPYPSATDLREANWPDALMLIASLRNDLPDLRAWRVIDEAPGYEAVPIEIYNDRLPWLASIRRQGLNRMLRDSAARAPRRVIWKAPEHITDRLPTGGVLDPGPDQPSPKPELDKGARRATIGILGGMGPLATADLYTKIINLTPAVNDQEHIPVIIYADPRVPDRSEALIQNGDDPTPWLVDGAQALEQMGVDFIVIPCNTAHAFLEPVQQQVRKPIISMIDAAADVVSELHPKPASVGLLATTGTVGTGLYQRALEERGVRVIVPDDALQADCVMAAIRDVKGGEVGETQTAMFQEVAEQLRARGAEALLAACTEIPLVFQQEHIDMPLVDTTDSLARLAVSTARYLDQLAETGIPQWETSTDGWDLPQMKEQQS